MHAPLHVYSRAAVPAYVSVCVWRVYVYSFMLCARQPMVVIAIDSQEASVGVLKGLQALPPDIRNTFDVIQSCSGKEWSPALVASSGRHFVACWLCGWGVWLAHFHAFRRACQPACTERDEGKNVCVAEGKVQIGAACCLLLA